VHAQGVALHEPDDAVVRQVAEGLVRLTGTAAAADQLERLYGRDRAVAALHRSGAGGAAAETRSEAEVTLDLTADDPVLDLRDAYAPAPPRPPRVVYWL
jgi:hypothetical protein